MNPKLATAIIVGSTLLAVSMFGSEYVQYLSDQSQISATESTKLQSDNEQASEPSNPPEENTTFLTKTNDVPQQQSNTFARLDSFKLAETTWGDSLNLNQQIPNTGFDAYYFNSRLREQTQPTAIFKEHQKHIAVNYVSDKLHNIPSEDFASYHIGKIEVNKDALYRINIDLSWAKIRVMIDKRVIIEANNSVPETEVFLEQGEHIVEVEYINNWHTTNFSVNIQASNELIPLKQIRTKLEDMRLPNDTVAYAVAAYESNNQDNTISIDTASIPENNFILLLNSYHAVNWKIEGKIPLAIVLDNQNSSVSNDRIPLLQTKERITYSFDYHSFNQPNSNCYCGTNHFSCDRITDLKQLKTSITALIGIPLKGGDSAYAASELRADKLLLTDENIQHNQKIAHEIDKQRLKCYQNNNQSFEQMFQSSNR